MRALFFGTPAIAVPSLEALTEIAEVVGVVCQPDKPAGRGLELKAPPVKERALALGIPVVQPTKVRTPEFAEWVRGMNADVAVVIAYGRILPPAVLEAPKKGCLNLHASLLPKYRGAAPITWCIVRGEPETGVCLMQMDEGMDTGPVFTTHAMPIGEAMTSEELSREIAALAARVVREDVPRVTRGELAATAQDHAAATIAPILEKENGRVAWEQNARAVHDHVRGMTPWPGAFTTLNGKTLKVLRTMVAQQGGSRGEPGLVIAADKRSIEVACGEGTVMIVRAQVEGKKPLDAPELVGGRAIAAGMRLGA